MSRRQTVVDAVVVVQAIFGAIGFAEEVRIRPGDWVATVSRAPLRLGSETTGTVRRWATLTVREVDGRWIGVTADRGVGEEPRWVESQYVLRVPDDLKDRSGKGLRLGHLGTPDAVALGTALSHPDRKVRQEAASRLRAMGQGAAPAAPALFRALSDASSTVRASAAETLGAIGGETQAVAKLMAVWDDESPAVRVASLRALPAFGAVAVPPAIAGLRDSAHRAYAAETLVRIGPPAVPALLDAQTGADSAVRRLAENALLRMGAPAASALAQALGDESVEVRCRAAFALGQLDAGAVPGLLTALKDQQSEVRMLAADGVARIGAKAGDAVPALVGTLQDPDERVRVAAVDALAAIGPGAQEAASALAKALPDPTLRSRCADALGRIGRPALPIILQLLEQPDLSVRQAAVYAIGRAWEAGGENPASSTAPEAARTGAVLVTLLKDPDETLRLLAADALAKMGSTAVPLLTEVVGNRAFPERSLAALALGRIGAKAKGAVAALGTALAADDVALRDAAAVALGEIGPSAASAVPALARLLPRVKGESSRYVAVALWKIAKHERARSVLGELLAADDPNVRVAAASFLGGLGKAAQPAVPALSRTLADGDSTVRAAAAAALAEIGPAAKSALPALQKAAQTATGETQLNVGWALWQVGKHRAAPELLAQSLADPQRESVRLASAGGLAKIGADAERAVPALTQALADRNVSVRSLSALALAELGAKAAAATPALARALEEAVGQPRLNVAWALWNVKRDARAITHAVALLQDPDDQVRVGAASVLARIGAPAKGAVPELCTALLDSHAESRAAAAAALGAIGKEADSALPLLIQRLTDADKSVRYQAGAALTRIEKEPGDAAVRIFVAYQGAPQLVQRQAVQAYIGLDPEKKPNVKLGDLVKALRRGDAKNRRLAALLLAGWDSSTTEARSAIRRAQSTEKDTTVYWCARLAGETQDARVDERVRSALAERKVKYQVTDSGDFRVIFNTRDRRRQAAFVGSTTEHYSHLEIRQVWSIGFEVKDGFSAELSKKLLEHNARLKWGAWQISGKRAVFVVKIAADADGEALWAAMVHATSVADEMERENGGGDRF